MNIRRFEDIMAWQRARDLTILIYKVSARTKFNSDWDLKGQIRRASSSIMSNIAEGFDSGFKNEFVRFLSISRRSASEVQSHLYIALDQKYISQQEFETIYQEAEEIRRMITAFIKYLRGSKSIGELAARNSQTR